MQLASQPEGKRSSRLQTTLGWLPRRVCVLLYIDMIMKTSNGLMVICCSRASLRRHLLNLNLADALVAARRPSTGGQVSLAPGGRRRATALAATNGRALIPFLLGKQAGVLEMNCRTFLHHHYYELRTSLSQSKASKGPAERPSCDRSCSQRIRQRSSVGQFTWAVAHAWLNHRLPAAGVASHFVAGRRDKI